MMVHVAYPVAAVSVRSPLAMDDMSRSGMSPRSSFIRARKAESGYIRQILKVTRWIGDLVNHLYDPEDPNTANIIDRALNDYSRHIEGWANSVATRMVTEVAARDRKAWMEASRRMGRALRQEIDTAPTGEVMRARIADQVELITSLPLDAAERVHRLTREGIVQGTRANEIAKEIMRSGEVSASRARLIARTEVSRTSTELTRARAEHVGSTHFIWRTAGDSDVRPSHRRLNGKTFAWGDPPECDPGHHALPGAIWNCRCYAEPVIDED
jgi:SPP1 gp7 family putative phage head morphogenesis protein